MGFAFEHYDAVGAWRDKEAVKTGAGADPAVDARSSLPDGRSFDGVDGLKAILKKDENKFLHCLCEKMLTYSLGRGLEFSDRPTLDGLREKLKNNGCTLSGLIRAVVATEAFQTK